MAETEPEQAGNQVREVLDRLFGEATSGSVFSTPERVGDTLVITAMAWERAGGFGFGSGSGTGGTGDEGRGSGGGGGGNSQGRPVAVITVGPGGVDVRPVIDFTKIGVTALLAAAGLWRVLRR